MPPDQVLQLNALIDLMNGANIHLSYHIAALKPKGRAPSRTG
jgi:hypothetical protein